jgi:hypothetical protein
LKSLLSLVALTGVLVLPLAATAQSSVQVGTLRCDVSLGVGMIIIEKQTLSCAFRQDAGGAVDLYTGSIDQFGVAIGKTAAGHLIWGVLAASKGLPPGALAGSYGGVGANASFGVGAGANVLVGGTGRSFSLQPTSVEGETGVNIAGGVTTLTLKRAN